MGAIDFRKSLTTFEKKSHYDILANRFLKKFDNKKNTSDISYSSIIKTSCILSMVLRKIREDEVAEEINNLKTKSACGFL